MSAMLSRDQRVVLALLDAEGEQAIASLTTGERLARCRDLPTMVLRHGPMLSLEYLDGKDAGLAALVRRGLRAALPGFSSRGDWPVRRDLVEIDAGRYLAVVDASVVVATWVKRLVEAEAPKAKTNGDAPTDPTRVGT